MEKGGLKQLLRLYVLPKMQISVSATFPTVSEHALAVAFGAFSQGHTQTLATELRGILHVQLAEAALHGAPIKDNASSSQS